MLLWVAGLAQRTRVMHLQGPGPARCLQALDEALDVLRGSFRYSMRPSDQETLGLAGAIYKRRWQATGQKDQLERSYHYYRRGYDLGPKNDFGYTAINAAFVLDQLADIERADGTRAASSIVRPRRRRSAKTFVDVTPEIRPGLAQSSLSEWWYVVTVAEALVRAWPNTTTPDHGWRRRRSLRTFQTGSSVSTAVAARHALSAPASGHDFAGRSESERSQLRFSSAFLDSAAARESAFIGKVGLALSGGGFRASLFHIGVLAKLAELDILRRVEVPLMRLRRIDRRRPLLSSASREDGDHGPRRLERGRVAQCLHRHRSARRGGLSRRGADEHQDARLRRSVSPVPLAYTIVAYTRTIRLGELFESQLFARIWDRRDSTGRSPRARCLLKDLKIYPRDAGGRTSIRRSTTGGSTPKCPS